MSGIFWFDFNGYLHLEKPLDSTHPCVTFAWDYSRRQALFLFIKSDARCLHSLMIYYLSQQCARVYFRTVGIFIRGFNKWDSFYPFSLRLYLGRETGWIIGVQHL